MKRATIIAVTTGFAFCIAMPLKATHVAAAEILYECLGDDQFLVTLNLYRDCAGNTLFDTQLITVNNPCGGPQELIVYRVGIEEVSQLCPDALSQSACSGGPYPGIERHTYTGVITLPRCDFIIFSWTLCCRNGAIDNIFADVNETDIYIQTTMYSQSFSCDNSPVFNSTPIPYLCVGYPASYGFGTTESDGNELVYTFIEALEAPGLPCVYLGGYTYTQPIPGMVLDPLTGQLTFTPPTIGNFVVTVLVSQYDAEGTLIGEVMRDMQFVVIACDNVPPDPATGTVQNLSSGVVTTPYSVNACDQEHFCFDFTIVDPDSGQTVLLQSNVMDVMPGASFTWSGTNPVSGTICWTVASVTDDVLSFQILASDNACPVTAFSSYVYTVTVCPPPELEIPNVFSPNSDGPNDAFYFIQFDGFVNYSMKIYNRWGMLIHETSTFTEDDLIWRPKPNVPDGTYYYVFDGETAKGEQVDRAGYFTLLR